MSPEKKQAPLVTKYEPAEKISNRSSKIDLHMKSYKCEEISNSILGLHKINEEATNEMKSSIGLSEIKKDESVKRLLESPCKSLGNSTIMQESIDKNEPLSVG
jgi:hypothetical protein